MPPSFYEFEAGEADAGLRLDVFLSEHVEDASRSYIQKQIKAGRAAINTHVCKRPGRVLATGDAVALETPPAEPVALEPEDIPLAILSQDAHVVVVNKPSGLVVHPAPGNRSGTLVNAVLHHCPDFQRTGETDRPGVVHRLDRDTSGVMILAKTPQALTHLGQQAHDHAFDRRYIALIRGELPEDRGVIEAPVGRSLTDRKKMSVTGVRGRGAVTHFETLERFGAASLVALRLETGRTHQIRVHLRFTGHPVCGDPTYGDTRFDDWNLTDEARSALESLQGQALHAELLGFQHPATSERMTFTAPPPEDFRRALEALRSMPQR